ncbi:MAG TPA: DUF3078 domain-containing protein [Salinimicrobium sp.]|nr:DUF3078 domain-containing protein [Salinimicrobium sp.]
MFKNIEIKKGTILLFFIFLSFKNFAAEDSTNVDEPIKYEEFWTSKSALGINISEMAFVNWSAGGNNSITTLLSADFSKKYKDAYYSWDNSISMKYGMNAQEGQELRKTEDQLEIKSTFGYRKDSLSNWYYSAKLNFNTQFSNGYAYPDTETSISSFMAPGYAFIGIGTEYSSPDETWNLYISPITEKSTFVLNQRMANEGMFGVTPAVRDEEGNIIEEGEKVRSQFGFLFTNNFSNEIATNVRLSHQLSLYSDYLHQFGNVDVDWQIDLNLIVNEYVKANIGAHLKYDDDVKHKEDTNKDGTLETFGPRLQLKQLLGVGLVYIF